MTSALSNFFNILIPISVVVQKIDPNCTYYQELVLGEVYYIFNKEYPQNYSSGTACQWMALSPPHSKIVLSCGDVRLPKSLNCFQDHIEVSSSDSEMHKYCGMGDFAFVTQENTLVVVLRSTTRSLGGRFLCSITAIEIQETNGTQNTFQKPSVQPICQCGWKNDKRIVGGHDTLVNEYPAMAGLIETSNRRVYCGGTIISHRYILTAAHCVYLKNVNDFLVLVGDHDISTGTDTQYSALYRARKFLVYPKYNSTSYEGDLALIQVDQMNFNDNVGPICLPFRYTATTFEGETVTALGWGQLEFSGAYSDILQEVDLQVIPNKDCREVNEQMVVPSEICTYSEDKDSCQSDSGGPILWQQPTNKNLYLVGIISHGGGCAASVPGINTRVSSFLNWIIDETSSESYCII